jgi:4-diphosphocytidyl-2-C-methyl-D-erythritol kinase
MLREPAGNGPSAVTVWAPAKVNLFLEVVGKRPDGYHELRTLMVAVSLYDTLTFTLAPSGPIRLSCPGVDLSTGPENLVVRAADHLRRQAILRGQPEGSLGADVVLTKRIPLAAGLAGGSTDAAATLVGLNRLWGLGLGRDELAALAADLGSDVAFFLDPPCAWCTGRGEVVERWPLGARLHLVLVAPPFGLSTAEVYRALDASPPTLTLPHEGGGEQSGDEIKAAVRVGDVAAIGRSLHNRLQEPAERLRPELADLLARLKSLGPAGCLMSGSGSTLFALCRDCREAARIGREFRQGLPADSGVRVFVVRSCV